MKRPASPKTLLRRRQGKTLTGIAAMFLFSFTVLAAPVVLSAKNKKDKNKAPESSKAVKGLPVQNLSDDEAILQAFNRLGFGPRPGDLERVKQTGLQTWIERQLHPESIDDSALEARLERFSTLKMSSARLLEEFPQPQVAARREGITVEEYRKQQQERMRQVAQATQADMQTDPQTRHAESRRARPAKF